MPRITVLTSETSLVDLFDVSFDEVYNFVLSMEELHPDDSFQGILSLYEKHYADKAPHPSDMVEILVRYIISKSRYIPITSIDSSNSPVIWRPLMPKTPPSGAIRIITEQRGRVLDKVRGKFLYVAAFTPLDVIGFWLNGSSSKTSEMSKIFERVISAHIYLRSGTRTFELSERMEPIEERSYAHHGMIMEKIDPKMIKILERLELPSSHSSRLSIISSILSAVSETDMLRILAGVDVEAIARALHTRRKNARLIAQIEEEKYKERVKWSFLLEYVRKRYSDRFHEGYPTTSIGIMRKFDEKEIEGLELAYKDFLSLSRAILSSSCPHVDIMRRMALKNNLRHRKSMMRELEPLIRDPSNRSTMHTCSLCDLPLICPHAMEAMSISTAKDMKRRLEKYADSSASASAVATCHICYEEIYSYDVEEAFIDYYMDIYRELSKYIWSSCMGIYGTMKFSPLIDAMTFTGQIAKAILPIMVLSGIGGVRNALQAYGRTGTLSFECQFYALLYIYAYILCCMRRYATDEDKASMVGLSLSEGSKGSSMSSQTEAILRRFGGIHSYIYGSVSGIDIVSEFKAIFIDVSRSSADFRFIIYFNRDSLVLSSIMRNTSFSYARRVLDVSGGAYRDERELFQKIFGMDMEEVIAMAKRGEKIFDLLKIPSSLSSPSLLRAYEAYLAFIQRGEVTPLAERDRPRYKLSVMGHAFGAFMGNARDLWSLPIYNGIALIVDEKGRLHEWDIYLYRGDDGSIKEKKRGDGWSPGKLIGYKCSICGLSRDETIKLDPRKCSEGREIEETIAMMLAFFSISCPEGGLHELVGAICKKCGFNLKEMRSEAFISRYLPSMLAEKRKMEVFRIEPPHKEKKRQVTVEFMYDPSKVLEVARVGGVTSFFMEAIGAMQGLEYDEVLAGKARIPFPSSRLSMQTETVRTYIRGVIFSFNNMRFINNVSGYREIDTRSILNEAKYPESSWNRLRRLPDFYAKYVKEIESIDYDESKTGKDLYLHSLGILCSLLLELTDTYTSGEFKPVAASFTKTMITHIVDCERYTCKAGEFDRAIFARRRTEDNGLTMKFDGEFDEELDEGDKGATNEADYTGYNDGAD